MEIGEIIKVILILIIVILPIVFIIVVDEIPSYYKLVRVDYKFIKNDKCYIVGELTCSNGIDDVDIYQVEKKDYDEITEGFEYSVQTKGFNYWSRFNKKLCDFKPMIYD